MSRSDPALAELWAACQDGLRPDLPTTVTAWADERRFISGKGSSAPGKWRTSRVPYLREIMDSMSARMPFTRAVLKKGAQVAGTEAGLNIAGETIDRRRVSVTFLVPNVEPFGKKFVKAKLDPMIEESPCLRGKIADKRAREGGNTGLLKEFPGGLCMVVGANSPSGLRSTVFGVLIATEVDGYAPSAGDEGDPLTLAERALRTFGDRKKIFEESTPLLDGTSRITRDYEACDVRLQLFVPCPLCHAMQVLEHEHLEWREGEPWTAAFRCVACAQLISHEHKTWMLARYEWRIIDDQVDDVDTAAPSPEPARPPRPPASPYLLAALERAGVAPVLLEAVRRGARSIGFDLPAYYSPAGWFSWADCAELYEKAQVDPALMQIYDNTVRGVAHKKSTDSPDHLRLYERRELYPFGIVPSPRVLFLTCGVDVQKDRIEWEIVGWGRGKESWSIDYGTIPGTIADPRTSDELDEVLARDVPCADGTTLQIRVMGLDTGHDSQNLYAWARRHVQPAYGAAGASCRAPKTVACLKGRDRGQRLVWSTTRDDLGGRHRGLRIYQVSAFAAATELYTWLRLDAPTDEDLARGLRHPPGYCHFPQYNLEYFKQLTADRCVTRYVHGYPQESFELPKAGVRNEAHDCRKYARAAAELFGISRFNDRVWRELELARGLVHDEEQGTLPLDAKYAPAAAAAGPAPHAGGEAALAFTPASRHPTVPAGALTRRPSQVSSWMQRR